MERNNAKEFAAAVQQLSRAAMFLIDNPGASGAFVLYVNGPDGKEFMHYGLYPTRKDAENMAEALRCDAETCGFSGESPIAAYGTGIREIKDIRKHKAFLVKAASTWMSRLEKDDSEAALHLLASLAS